MTSIKDSTYRPVLPEKARVRLLKREHHEYTRPATLIHALPNPSGRPENQWYDVRFDDGVYGRFLARYLERVSSDGAEAQAGGQTSAA
jgi:hypothetical protein